MAVTAIQAGTVVPVVPSDTIDIVHAGTRVISSTTTATTSNKLTDSAGLFTTTNAVAVGDIIINTTDNTTATVTAVDSATALSISADIMAISETYEIYRGSTNGSTLYVGGAGNVSAVVGGSTRIFVGVIGGTFLPIHATRVNSTGTTATSILALN